MIERRRLAAILVADVVGYSKLMGSDEASTLAHLEALRTTVIEPQIAKYAGRLFKAVGDGFLIEFASAVQAVSCAKAIQEANVESRLPLRIGIQVGDVVVQGDDLMGDGVNVAARIESVAESGGIALSRQVHDQVRDKVDAVFTDKGEIELKNIQRPVQVFVIGGTKVGGAPTALPLPDKPSIAVLPFQNMSGDPEQEYFADGIVEDVITALSRFKSLFVIARNSSFTYKGKAIDIRQVGRELGVRYVLEGSVRKAGSRIRISGQLIRAETGAHVWAERFEGATDDVFDLQDEVVEKVIAAIAPSVERAEIEAAQRKPTANLNAHDYYLRALPFWWSGDRDKSDEALRLLQRALEIDPRHSSAMGLLLAVYGNRKAVGLVRDLEKEDSEARLLLPQVVQIGREDAVALGYAAWAIAFILRDLTFAQEQVKRALTLNANLSNAWGFSAWINLWSGNPTQAVEDLTHANRLDPLNESANWVTAWAHAHFYLDRHEDAVRLAESMLQRNPVAHAALRIGSAAAALGGQMEAAEKFASRLKMVDPSLRVSRLENYLGPYRHAASVAKYKQGLRLAGLPE